MKTLRSAKAWGFFVFVLPELLFYLSGYTINHQFPYPMTSTEKRQLVEQLRRIDTFQDIESPALEWLIEKGQCLQLEPGEHLFKPQQPAEYMSIILEGKLVFQIQQGGELREIGTLEPGGITGILPFSRMKESRAYIVAVDPVKAVSLHKQHFVEMVNVSYAMVQNLVGIMANRIREFTHRRAQDEKLIALGKISAGLAHELNNPASAMERNAEELYRKIHKTPERFKEIITMSVTPAETDRINTLLFQKIREWKPDRLGLLEKEDAMDDMIDWLEDQNIKNAEDLSETFVEFAFSTDDLEQIQDILEQKDLAPVLWWLESTLSLERLISEIKESASRISSLVQSVKGYTHMDRGSRPEKLDIHQGITSTLIMLKHKLKQKQIQVKKDFSTELPEFFAHAGELNQIWTNLIDNAIDAMDTGGQLQIHTYPDRHFICVDIMDNGHGIPEEILSQIYDPFFTTKGVGEGSGVGLNIVQRIISKHKGTIKVQSAPGKTVFSICLPAQQYHETHSSI